MWPPCSSAVEADRRWDKVCGKNRQKRVLLLICLPLINHCVSVLQSTFESLFESLLKKNYDWPTCCLPFLINRGPHLKKNMFPVIILHSFLSHPIVGRAPVLAPTINQLHILWVSGQHVEPIQGKLLDSTLTALVIFASSSSSSTISFTHSDTAVGIWQSDTTLLWVSPKKHLIHLTEDVQVSEITLPSFIHLLLVTPFHPFCIWPLSLFSKILFCLLTSQFSSALSKMESADCCKWPNVQINGKDKKKRL